MEYKISKRNQISVLQGQIIFTVLILITICLFGFYQGFSVFLFKFFGIFYLINLGIVLFLHIQYYIEDKNKSIIISLEEKQLIYKHKNLEKIIDFNEIQDVEMHMAPSFYVKNAFRVPFDKYHYAVIFLKSNERIIITCLMSKNVKDIFKYINIDIIRIRRFFPYIN